MQIFVMPRWMEAAVMYKAYWGMEFNPFDKEQKGSDYYQGMDFLEATKRLEHLKNVKGIGVFTGQPGCGKTCVVRNFTQCLNKSLYQVIYIQLTTVGINDFYRDLSFSLGLTPCYRKIDNFKQIQERIRTLYREQRITPIFWIDEAQYLHHSILADLKILMNFEMDSRNYAILILSGLPAVTSTLSMRVHEALAQRVVIHYGFSGLTESEVKSYLKSRLELCGVSREIIQEAAYNSMDNYSSGSIRKLDQLMHKALMIGCSKKVDVIDGEIVMEAINEAEFI